MKFSTKFIVLLAIVVAIAGSLAAQPELEIVENRFDFGNIPQNSTLRHYFWFKSVGTDTLTIKEIKTGCTCVLIPLESKVIAPGDSMLVGISWNVKRRLGRIGRYPYIFTNAEEDPVQVSLQGKAVKSAEALRPVAFAPYKFEVSGYGENRIDSLEFKITNFSSDEVQLRQVSFVTEECTIYLPEKIGPKSEAVGYIKVNEEYLDKEFKNSLTVELNDKLSTRVTVPIRRKLF